MAQRMFHLVDPAVWATAGESYAPASLATEGFLHLSYTGQVAGSADRHLADAAELVALEVDPSAGDIRVEDSYGSGTAYPHLYGPLPRSAVLGVHPLSRGDDGGWRFSADGAGARPSPGR